MRLIRAEKIPSTIKPQELEHITVLDTHLSLIIEGIKDGAITKEYGLTMMHQLLDHTPEWYQSEVIMQMVFSITGV